MPKVYLEQFIDDWSKVLYISGRWKWSELLTATQSQSVGNVFQESPKMFLFLTLLDSVQLCLPFVIFLFHCCLLLKVQLPTLGRKGPVALLFLIIWVFFCPCNKEKMLKPRNDSQLEQRAIYLLIEEVVTGGSDFASSMPGASQQSKHGKVFQEFELPADLRHSFDKFFSQQFETGWD